MVYSLRALLLPTRSPKKGCGMENVRLCEAARLAFFATRLRRFEVSELQDQDFDPKTTLQKI